MDRIENLDSLKEKIKEFCEARDWEKYHNAKDLAIGIITESSELLEHFRFKSEAEIEEMFKSNKKKEISEEMADVFFFLLRLAQQYDIDLSKELDDKLQKNEVNYPKDKSYGSNKKYTEL